MHSAQGPATHSPIKETCSCGGDKAVGYPSDVFQHVSEALSFLVPLLTELVPERTGSPRQALPPTPPSRKRGPPPIPPFLPSLS